MRALIVFDSKTGMTERIAHHIATGMKEVGFPVDVVRAAEVKPDDLKAADAWVFGSPTHMGTATREAKWALRTAIEGGSAGKKGTAFDTRYAKVQKGAANKMRKMMEEAGVRMVVDPEGFAVQSSKGPLAEGEEQRAITFGRRIAGALRQ